MKPESSPHSSKAVALAAVLAALSALPVSGQNPALSTPFVISRVQLVYSMVSHRQSLPDRVAFYDQKGTGNDQYATPMLVCDPLVTLYNPANTSASRSKVRVLLSDPPIGFKFKKNANYLRNEFGSAGGFHPMGRFQINNESNQNVRKRFVMLLRELGVNGTPGAGITLGAGESRTFAPWVEENWTWGLETAVGYMPHAFYDWNADHNLTTQDERTGNLFGVEAVSGWDPIAGFQMDNLSYGSTQSRPASTYYNFESANGMNGGWVNILNNETVTVEAKAMRANPLPGADFTVDLLGGNIQDTSRDILRSFPMPLGDLPSLPQINRTFQVGDLLQGPADNHPAGKTPFAVITMIAKTEALLENRFYERPPLPAADLYEMHFTALTDFNQNDRISASDRLASGFQVKSMSRSGDQLFLDFATGPEIEALRIVGTSSLEEGFTEDLSDQTISVPGPPGSGLQKAIVNIAGKGPRYFIRLEEVAGTP
jgi:hypothetical protein